jgi:DNA repair protein RecO (recombination protein O)
MITRTNAIAIRIVPYSRTSHVVSWLTSEHGKLVTLVKGACRPKSPFLGQYDMFYTCELLYYAKDRNGLHIAKECCPVRIREGLRHNWKGAACASYTCDLLLRIAHAGGHEPAMFDLLSDSLDFLSENIPMPQFVPWFEIRLAGLMGIAPQLDQCAMCHSAVPHTRRGQFSVSKGGILCPSCAAKEITRTMGIDEETVAILRHWQETDSPRLAQNEPHTAGQAAAAANISAMFLRYHLEIETIPPSRKIAMEMATLNRKS